MNLNEYQREDDSEGTRMTAMGRIIGVFVAPTAAFKSIKQKSEIWIPMVLVPLLMALYYLLFWNSYSKIIIRQMEAQYDKMGVEVMPGMIDTALNIQRIMTPISVVVMYFVTLFIGALYYWVCSLIAKADLSYGKAVVLTAYVSLFGALSWLVTMVLTAAMGEYDITKPMTSLASLLPESMYQTTAYFAAIPIEVFSIWSTVVTFIALRVMGGFSQKAAGWTVGIMFAFGVLMSVGSGMLAQMFT